MTNEQKNPTFKTAKHIHFVGIKGVGMTALALCAQDLGIKVTGSDVAQDFVTKEVLHQRKLDTISSLDAQNLPDTCDLVVYTGANGGVTNIQVETANTKNIRTVSHAEAVAEAMDGKYGISICGVGGKTSTAAMLANILEYANLNPSFVIGVGKVLNLQTPGRMGSGKHIVVEADEYAVSPGQNNAPRFSYQHPQIIICTNVAYDHPDVYASIQSTKDAFTNFFNNLPSDGLLIMNGDSKPAREITTNKRTIYFGETPKNDWYVKDSFVGQGKQLITVGHQDETFNLMLSVPGVFNAKNAIAAYIAAREMGIEHQTAIEGLQLFRGSKRRFEKVAEKNDIVYFDDYAHHPTEILATLKAAREWLPLYRLVCVFQPHTFSRTKALFDQFAQSFNYADEVVITDIYGARESDDPEVSGYKLAEEIKKHHPFAHYVPRAELVSYLKSNLKSYDALFTLGAGEIYSIHEDLLK
jgi:UDP-N-acetylmuramate--alanine ligase